ncbi:hypothetical protein AB6D06_22525 [Vibrio sp. 10N.239.311.G01]|uniref:hypothetical protein n=1 Tax=Vibrio sp. 10N.239.311.G01 TaxID=3229976 RepID=UPI00354D8235
MIPIENHIATLSKILFATSDVGGWVPTMQWLNMAASIESINIDTIKHNDSFGWCSPSDDYDIARDAVLKEFTFNLTIFNFVWGALESCIDIIKVPKHPNKQLRGKITNTCYYIGQIELSSSIPELIKQTTYFSELAEQCYGYDRVNKRINRLNDFGISGVGLNAVYELRNKFAHGSLDFPEPGQNNEPDCIENNLVICATRIVLLSMQVILLRFYQHIDKYELYLRDNGFGLEGDWYLEDALRQCHQELEYDEERYALL